MVKTQLRQGETININMADLIVDIWKINLKVLCLITLVGSKPFFVLIKHLRLPLQNIGFQALLYKYFLRCIPDAERRCNSLATPPPFAV